MIVSPGCAAARSLLSCAAACAFHVVPPTGGFHVVSTYARGSSETGFVAANNPTEGTPSRSRTASNLRRFVDRLTLLLPGGPQVESVETSPRRLQQNGGLGSAQLYAGNG